VPRVTFGHFGKTRYGILDGKQRDKKGDYRDQTGMTIDACLKIAGTVYYYCNKSIENTKIKLPRLQI
jgi:hypothetical protein